MRPHNTSNTIRIITSKFERNEILQEQEGKIITKEMIILKVITILNKMVIFNDHIHEWNYYKDENFCGRNSKPKLMHPLINQNDMTMKGHGGHTTAVSKVWSIYPIVHGHDAEALDVIVNVYMVTEYKISNILQKKSFQVNITQLWSNICITDIYHNINAGTTYGH